jgi:hypothetical protein
LGAFFVRRWWFLRLGLNSFLLRRRRRLCICDRLSVIFFQSADEKSSRVSQVRLPGETRENAEIGQEYCRLFFSILLIEPPKTIRLAMAEQPDWQQISRLSLIGSMIDGMLQDAEEHYHTLLQASPKPHVLDDYTVGRVLEVFGRQKDDLWLFEEQLARWKMDELSVGQRQELDRLTEQVGPMPDCHRLDPFAR